ncbi:MAG: sulfur globule family protein [Candidatus Thiodiazotropha endolucinida]
MNISKSSFVFISVLIGLPFSSAFAWWGGPGWGNTYNNGWGDGWGDGSGDFSFGMSGSARGSGYGRGNNYYRDYYGYGPYGYGAPYSYPYAAPAAPGGPGIAPKARDCCEGGGDPWGDPIPDPGT